MTTDNPDCPIVAAVYEMSRLWGCLHQLQNQRALRNSLINWWARQAVSTADFDRILAELQAENAKLQQQITNLETELNIVEHWQPTFTAHPRHCEQPRPGGADPAAGSVPAGGVGNPPDRQCLDLPTAGVVAELGPDAPGPADAPA